MTVVDICSGTAHPGITANPDSSFHVLGVIWDYAGTVGGGSFLTDQVSEFRKAVGKRIGVCCYLMWCGATERAAL